MTPAYNKKITRQMDYPEFKEGIHDLPDNKQALLSILFFAGCRVSEALALTPNDITCTSETVFVNFFRLKGSKQTDPVPLPKTKAIAWLCGQVGNDRLFSYHRTTAYRIVNRTFEGFYPHFFRQNRIVNISDKFGDATVYSYVGICAQSIDHYRGKVDIMKVGKALLEELD